MIMNTIRFGIFLHGWGYDNGKTTAKALAIMMMMMTTVVMMGTTSTKCTLIITIVIPTIMITEIMIVNGIQ